MTDQMTSTASPNCAAHNSATAPRRGLLAGLGALAAAPAAQAAVTANPDAALLAMAAEMDAINLYADPLWDEWNDLPGGTPRHAEVLALLGEPQARRRALWNAIEVLPARTMAGVLAKARLAKRDCFIMGADGQPEDEDLLIYGLLADLLALQDGAA